MAKEGTYLAEVQNAIYALRGVYNNVGYIRDVAEGGFEKDCCNGARGALSEADTYLVKLEEMIIKNGRHEMKL